MACASKKDSVVDSNPIYGRWEITVIDGKDVMSSKPITLEFTSGNKVTGFAGCNRLNGGFAMESGNRIRFNDIATTRMSCPDLKMESEVLDLLRTVDNYTIADGKLMLNVGRRAPLAILTKFSENEITNKYWKLKTIEGQNVEMTDNQTKEQYFILRGNNIVNGFAGCNNFSGSYKIEAGNRIRFDKMAVTMMICTDEKIMEPQFLKVFELADNYTINGDQLMLNVGRRAPLAVFEAVYF